MLNALNISDNCYNCFNSYKRKKHQELFEIIHGNKIKEVTFASLYSKLGFKPKLIKTINQQQLSHSQSKTDLYSNHYAILSKPLSLPKLKPKQSPKSLSYVYLHYYGDTKENIINDYHNVLRKEQIVINPHQIIESLKTLVMPRDIYGEKIFEFVSEMANGCYGSNCSRSKAQLQKSESASQTTETKEKVQNFLGCKINVKTFVLEKVLHSVITHCMDIRTKSNERISLQEIKTLYNKELEKIRECLTQNNDKPRLIDKRIKIKRENSIDYNIESFTKDRSCSLNNNNNNNLINEDSSLFNFNIDVFNEVNDSRNSLHSNSSNNITRFKCLPLVEEKVKMKDINELKAQSFKLNNQINPATTRELIRKVFLNFKGEGSNNNITQNEFNNSQTSALLNDIQCYNENRYITQLDAKLNPKTTQNSQILNSIKIKSIPETEDLNPNEEDLSSINNEIKSRNKNQIESEMKSFTSNRMASIEQIPNDKLDDKLYNKKKNKFDNTIPSSIESFSDSEMMIQPALLPNVSNKRSIRKTMANKLHTLSKDIQSKQSKVNNNIKGDYYNDISNSNELINYKEQSNIGKNINSRREREKNKDLMYEYGNIQEEGRISSKQSNSRSEDVHERSDITSNRLPQTTRSKSIEEVSIRKDITNSPNSPVMKMEDPSLIMSNIDNKENINKQNQNVSSSNKLNTIRYNQIQKQSSIELQISSPETSSLNKMTPYQNETPTYSNNTSNQQNNYPLKDKEPKTSNKRTPIYKSQKPSPPKKITMNKRSKDTFKKRDQSPFIKQSTKPTNAPTSKQSITSSINSSYQMKQKYPNSNNSMLSKYSTMQTPSQNNRNQIQRSSIRGSIKPYKKLPISQIKCANTLLLAFKTCDNFLIDKNFYNNQLYYKTLHKVHHKTITNLLSLNPDMKYNIYQKVNHSPKLNIIKKSKEHFLQKYLLQDNDMFTQGNSKRGNRFSISSTIHSHLLETLELANSKMHMNHYNYYNNKFGKNSQEGNNSLTTKRKNKFARRYNYHKKTIKKSSLIDELNNTKKEGNNNEDMLEYDFQHQYKKLLREKQNSLFNKFEHKDKESHKYDMFINQVEHLREENTEDYIKKITGYFDEEYIKSELLKNKHQEDRLNKFAINFQWGIDRRKEYKKFMERKLSFEYACVFKNK